MSVLADVSDEAGVASPPLQPVSAPSGIGAITADWLPADRWDEALADWQGLADSAAPNVFLAPSFGLAARAIDPAPGLGAVVLMRDGCWIGFVPGRFGMRGAAFALWTHPYAPYGLPLIAKGHENEVLRALFGCLSGRAVAALEWPMLDDGPVAAALETLCSDTARRIDRLDQHRRACLTDPPPALSKEHRRLARRLADAGAVVQASTASGCDLEMAMQAFLALEAEGWKGRAGTALAASAATRGFFMEAIGGLATRGEARIDLMLVGGKPVAAGVVLMARDRAWYWKTAYDEAFARQSPGLLLSHAIGAQLMADGHTHLVDSCAVAGHPMIDRIWPGRLAVTSRFIAVTPGWRYRGLLLIKRGLREAKAFAKRVLKR